MYLHMQVTKETERLKKEDAEMPKLCLSQNSENQRLQNVDVDTWELESVKFSPGWMYKLEL